MMSEDEICEGLEVLSIASLRDFLANTPTDFDNDFGNDGPSISCLLWTEIATADAVTTIQLSRFAMETDLAGAFGFSGDITREDILALVSAVLPYDTEGDTKAFLANLAERLGIPYPTPPYSPDED